MTRTEKTITRSAHARGFLRDRRGVAAVETALVFPLLIMLLFGTIEAARAAYTKAVLTFAVGEATRYAIARDTSTTTLIRTQIENNLLLLSPANIINLVVNEVTNADLTKTVQMTVTYQFTSILPIINIGTINLTASSTFIRE